MNCWREIISSSCKGKKNSPVVFAFSGELTDPVVSSSLPWNGGEYERPSGTKFRGLEGWVIFGGVKMWGFCNFSSLPKIVGTLASRAVALRAKNSSESSKWCEHSRKFWYA